MKRLQQLCGAAVLACALVLPVSAGQMATTYSAKGQMPTTEQPAKPTSAQSAPALWVENALTVFAPSAGALLDALRGAFDLF